jgi:hypothetical protein
VFDTMARSYEVRSSGLRNNQFGFDLHSNAEQRLLILITLAPSRAVSRDGQA